MKTERPRHDAGHAVAEQVLSGLGVAPGIAIGPAHIVDSSIETVPEYTIGVDEVEDELRRFADAVDSAHLQIAELEARASSGDGAG